MLGEARPLALENRRIARSGGDPSRPWERRAPTFACAFDAVHEEIREWQARPLDDVYAIVYFDAVRTKVREEGLVPNKAVYLGIGVTCAGRKEVLGLWIEQTEGARFWFAVMNELKARGLQAVLIAVVDGLKGFPEAIESVYPDAVVQTCVVHLIRHSLAYASWKERKALAAALKGVYQGADGGRDGECAGRLRGRPLGPQVSGDPAQLGIGVGSRDSVLRVLGADPSGVLHDQRD